MRASLLASAVAVLAACSASVTRGPDDVPAPDVADVLDVTVVTDVNDAAPPRDAALDARDASRDVLDASADAPRDAPGDVASDWPSDPGQCGPATRECLCDCAGNAACQNACIARNDDCGFCVYEAATRCCPDRSRLLDQCIDESGCTDDPCIRARCGDRLRDFEGCFAAMQQSEPACQREMQRCLGADYPMVRCVRQ